MFRDPDGRCAGWHPHGTSVGLVIRSGVSAMRGGQEYEQLNDPPGREGRRGPPDASSVGRRGHRPGEGHRGRGRRRAEEGRRARVGHPLRHRQQAHPAADADRQPDRQSARHAARARGCCSPRTSTPCRSVPGRKPMRKGDRIVSDGTTALGGDNRTGCAVLVVAGRDAAEAQAAAPADHAAVHRARGERAARRPRTGPGGPGRGDDGLQRRRQASPPS